MCLYEPINGDYPTESFCNMHGPNCEGCSYNYDLKYDLATEEIDNDKLQ